MINLQEAQNLRFAVLFSMISGKNISFKKQQQFEDYEILFLNLISTLTKGTKLFLMEKKTRLDFKPGSINQNHFENEIIFDCGLTRSISYFLEPIFILGLYSKDYLEFTLTGITNDNIDISVDAIKNSLSNFLKQISNDQIRSEINIIKRGFRPSGGGRVKFKIQYLKNPISQINLTNTKKLIKRIRGVAVSSKVSTNFLNEMISKSREIFNDYIPDVWIFSELVKNNNDRFYGLSLFTNTNISQDYCYDIFSNQQNIESPAQIAEICCKRLLDDIQNSSNQISTNFQVWVFILMSLTDKKVNKAIFGRVTQHSIEILQYIKIFFDVKFHFQQIEENGKNLVLAKCQGSGLKNRNVETE